MRCTLAARSINCCAAGTRGVASSLLVTLLAFFLCAGALGHATHRHAPVEPNLGPIAPSVDDEAASGDGAASDDESDGDDAFWADVEAATARSKKRRMYVLFGTDSEGGSDHDGS